VTKGSGNEKPLTDLPNSDNRRLFQTGRSPSISQRVRSAGKSISIGALQLLLGDWCYRSWIIERAIEKRNCLISHIRPIREGVPSASIWPWPFCYEKLFTIGHAYRRHFVH